MYVRKQSGQPRGWKKMIVELTKTSQGIVHVSDSETPTSTMAAFADRMGRRKELLDGEVTWISQKEWEEEQQKTRDLNAQQSLFAFCLDDSGNKRKVKIVSPILVEVIKVIVPLHFFESTSDGVSFQEPYAHLFHYSEDIHKELKSRVDPNSDHCRDFYALESFLGSYAGHGIIWKSLEQGKQTAVSFDNIWALFRFGELMVVQDRLDERRLFKFARLHQNIKDVGFQKDVCMDVEVHFWYIVWSPGKRRFRQECKYFEVRRFAGYQKVISLPIYPLRYEEDDARDSLLKRLQNRGKKWADLISNPPSCFEHSGYAIPENETGRMGPSDLTLVSPFPFLEFQLPSHCSKRVVRRANHPGPEGLYVSCRLYRRY